MQDCLEVIVKHTGANNCLFSFGNAIKQAACGIVVLEPGVYKLIAYTTDKTELNVNVSKGQKTEKIDGAGLIIRLVQVQDIADAECVTINVAARADVYMLISREYFYEEEER